MATPSKALEQRVAQLEQAIRELALLVGGVRGGHSHAVCEIADRPETRDQSDTLEYRN